MNEDLKILLRLQEIYESKLLFFSSEYTCSIHRKGYRHEYTETKAILNLLERLISNEERNSDKEWL